MIRRVFSALLLAGALALAGCGGGTSGPSESAFKSAYKQQKVQLGKLGEAVGRAVEGAGKKTDAELTVEFKSLAERATAMAGSLGQLEAPSKYKAELQGLVSAITQVAGTLHSIEAAAAAHDANSAKAGGEAIVAEGQQVKSDDQALSSKLGLPNS